MEMKLRKKWMYCLIVWLLPVAVCMAAPDIEPVDNGPIHEAFAEPITGVQVLSAFAEAPPEPIQEGRPRNTDSDLEWLSGYWSWSKERNDYIWISGVYRRSPPGYRWVSGEWEKLPEGWVWLRGFWFPIAERSFAYIEDTPLDALDEQVGSPPSDDYFWASGYWEYDWNQRKYNWLRGVWHELDPEWVFVPAHYVWRTEGYIFIPAHWDYPGDRRGTVYKPVVVPHAMRQHGLHYTPCCVWQHDLLCRHMLLSYPDHLCFVHHCWHFHRGWWDGCDCIPSWWSWNTWWCFSWHDHWALWWWWGHPGFPHPWWMTAFFANHMAPPSHWILDMLSQMEVPLFVTPWGVLPANLLLEALQKMGLEGPVITLNDKDVQELHDLAAPEKRPEGKPLRPTGKLGDVTNILKPTLDPAAVVPDGGKVTIPPKDDLAPAKPEIQKRPEIQVVPRYPDVDIQVDKPPRGRYPRPRPRPRPRFPNDDVDHHHPRPRPRPRYPQPKWPPQDQEHGDGHHGHDHDNDHNGGDQWQKPRWPQVRWPNTRDDTHSREKYPKIPQSEAPDYRDDNQNRQPTYQWPNIRKRSRTQDQRQNYKPYQRGNSQLYKKDGKSNVRRDRRRSNSQVEVEWNYNFNPQL